MNRGRHQDPAETGRLWRDFVEAITDVDPANAAKVCLDRAVEARRFPASFMADGQTVWLPGDLERQYFALVRALGAERDVAAIASKQHLRRLLGHAIVRALRDHASANPRKPADYLDDTRSALRQGVRSWTVVTAVAGLAFHGLPGLALGKTRVFSVESEEARCLGKQIEGVLAEIHTDLAPHRNSGDTRLNYWAGIKVGRN